MAEEADLKSVKCGFESHGGHMDKLIEKLMREIGESEKFWLHYADCPDCELYNGMDGLEITKCVLTNEVRHNPVRPPGIYENMLMSVYGPMLLNALRNEKVGFDALQKRETTQVSLEEPSRDCKTLD